MVVTQHPVAPGLYVLWNFVEDVYENRRWVQL